MSAPEVGQRAAHGTESAPKPSQKCREISSSEISTNNSAASAVVVQTFPSTKAPSDTATPAPQVRHQPRFPTRL